ncbi:hypothetical protein ACJX0J_012057 [Zea mays]
MLYMDNLYNHLLRRALFIVIDWKVAGFAPEESLSSGVTLGMRYYYLLGGRAFPSPQAVFGTSIFSFAKVQLWATYSNLNTEIFNTTNMYMYQFLQAVDDFMNHVCSFYEILSMPCVNTIFAGTLGVIHRELMIVQRESGQQYIFQRKNKKRDFQLIERKKKSKVFLRTIHALFIDESNLQDPTILARRWHVGKMKKIYQPTLSIEMGSLQEIITSTKRDL